MNDEKEIQPPECPPRENTVVSEPVRNGEEKRASEAPREQRAIP